MRLIIETEPRCGCGRQRNRPGASFRRAVVDWRDDDALACRLDIDRKNYSTRPDFLSFLQSALLLIAPKIGISDNKTRLWMGYFQRRS